MLEIQKGGEDTNIPSEVREININFKDGKVLVLAKVDVGVEASIGMEVRIEAGDDDQPKILIEKIEVGRGPTLTLQGLDTQ